MIKLPYKADNVLFLDIETVPETGTLTRDKNAYKTWIDYFKVAFAGSDQDPVRLYDQRAAIYPEFGRIVCISAGFFHHGGFRVKGVSDDDERVILKWLFSIISDKKVIHKHFCGHNIIDFDIPYIVRRAIALGVEVPDELNFHGKKPWELSDVLIDTMVIWSCGSRYLGSKSLESVCHALRLPSPKRDMNGKLVRDAWYGGERKYKKIINYCNGDVVTAAKVLLRVQGIDVDFEVESHVQCAQLDSKKL